MPRGKRRREPYPPPWRRYVVFCENGEPTGWAMGFYPGHGIRQWLHASDQTDMEVARMWKSWSDQGYTERPVDLIPVDPPTTPARAGEE